MLTLLLFTYHLSTPLPPEDIGLSEERSNSYTDTPLTRAPSRRRPINVFDEAVAPFRALVSECPAVQQLTAFPILFTTPGQPTVQLTSNVESVAHSSGPEWAGPSAFHLQPPTLTHAFPSPCMSYIVGQADQTSR